LTKKRPRHAPPARPKGRGPARSLWLLWLGGILLLTFAVYLPSLSNGFTNWDDDIYVTENPLLRAPDLGAVLTTPVSGNYHPLTILSLALNYRLSGLDPRSYHWLSLLLHLANTALVFWFVRKLTGGRLWTSVACALFFGVHPMHVESVAWIAERKDVLYAFFYLFGLILYLRYLDRRKWVWLAAAFASFLLSTASKPAAVVFPLTLLAIDWFRRRGFTRAVLLEKVPFFAISVAGGILTLLAQEAGGATTIQWALWDKVLFASYGIAMYVVKFFLPVRLSAIYPYVHIEGQGPGAEFYVAFASVVILLPLTLYLCRRLRPVQFGLLFFFINIVLVLQFITVGTAVMAERYTYLPYIGITFALAWWLDERPGSLPRAFPVKPALAGVFAFVLLLSVYQTWNRCGVWRDSGTLWNDTLRKYPRQNVDAYLYRGKYLLEDAGRPAAALADFDEALALNAGVARAWNFKGMALARLGRDDSAFVCVDRALRLEPDSPAALNNRGGLNLRRGDAAAAVEDFTKALELNPRLWDAYTNRALAYARLGDRERQIADLRDVLRLNPANPENHVYRDALGQALQAVNRPREAIEAYDAAIQSAPAGDARLGRYYLDRSYSWWAMGERERARADAAEAERRGVAVDPGYRRALAGAP
jgi:tetratricopeptide (TPR) repeat protein